MRKEKKEEKKGETSGIVLKYVCFYLVCARIFADTSKILYVCATERSAQDWIRRIDKTNKVGRAEERSPISPWKTSFVSPRFVLSSKELPSQRGGEEKEREKKWTIEDDEAGRKVKI